VRLSPPLGLRASDDLRNLRHEQTGGRPRRRQRIDSEAPTLILLDELPPYFKNAVTQTVGGGTLARIMRPRLADVV
jgi:hypothetical protein